MAFKINQRLLPAYGSCLALALLCLMALRFRDILCYDRALILTEPWRLLTAHIAHLNLHHAELNLLALCMLPVVLPWQSATKFLTVAMLTALGISLGLYYFYPHVVGYVGLSGVLHGLLAWLIINAVFFNKAQQAINLKQYQLNRNIGLGLGLGLVTKLAYEGLTGLSASADFLGAPVIFQAHQMGALIGSLLAFIIQDEIICVEKFPKPD